MDFVAYLAQLSQQEVCLEDLPIEQQASENTLILLESIVAEYSRKNEQVFCQSDNLAAATALG